MKILPFTLLLISTSCMAQADKPVGGGCEECDNMYIDIPAKLSAQTTITPKGEPGETLIIEGTIFKPDGTTPAEGIILYVYQTDAQGLYSKGKEPGSQTRHGRLRGWVKTGKDGKYKFTTIRPASYPNSNNPQHIHPLIKEPGLTRYYIDEYLFDDDPLLTSAERARQEGRGGSGIVKLTKDENGVWHGTREIILGLKVYK